MVGRDEEEALAYAIKRLPGDFGLVFDSAQQQRYDNAIHHFRADITQFDSPPTIKSFKAGLMALLQDPSKLKTLDIRTVRLLGISNTRWRSIRDNPSVQDLQEIKERAQQFLEKKFTGGRPSSFNLGRLIRDLLSLWKESTGKLPPVYFNRKNNYGDETYHAFFDFLSHILRLLGYSHHSQDALFQLVKEQILKFKKNQ